MIEVKHLSKRYGEHIALDDISFIIEQGHVYGFLGPNGAGKSTTMNILTGCLAASEGQVTVNGHDIFEDGRTVKRLIGYLPEQPPLYQEMTVKSYLYFVAEAKEVEKALRESQIEKAMQVTGIKTVEDRLIRNLSKGYKQRVGIAQALLGNPQIILLDEPTVGLDPRQIIEIRQLIRELGQEHTVVLSSHILSEVRSVCDRIIILSNGRVVASDTPDHLENLFAGKSTVQAVVKATEEESSEILRELPGIVSVQYKADSGITELPESAVLTIETEGQEDICEALFFGFAKRRRPILRLSVVKADLEAIFLELTSEEVTASDSDSETGI